MTEKVHETRQAQFYQYITKIFFHFLSKPKTIMQVRIIMYWQMRLRGQNDKNFAIFEK